jgi:excisionase family DNA binding protein
MTTREVAQAIGITTREVNRMVNEGTLRHVRGFRKPMKFYREEILRWLRGEEAKR